MRWARSKRRCCKNWPARRGTSTIGAAIDLESEDLRRLFVNACYDLTGLKVPAKADVGISGTFSPSKYGFNGAKKGLKPADFAPGTGK